MVFFPVFLSVVLVTRNKSALTEKLISSAAAVIAPLVTDYEIIIVDNASNNDTLSILRKLTSEEGQPNLQVYALTKEVSFDTAAWVGLENALGDYVAVIDPLADDVSFLPKMLAEAVNGVDVVFATNTQKSNHTLFYRGANLIFNNLYKSIHGVHLTREAPPYRIVNKKIINFILQHPQPSLTYRHLPVTGGFSRVNLNYISTQSGAPPKNLMDSLDRGIRLLITTTRAPMRLVTWLSLFGAVTNLLYSLYVVGIGLFKENVQPGWISLSLQQSGMFFLISLVLLVLGEYILEMARLSNEGPTYHIAQEFTSARMTRREKLNIEEVTAKPAFDQQKLNRSETDV